MKFKYKDVFSAYKKLKHNFYYDNASLFIRNSIAEFEASFSFKDNGHINKISDITDNINDKTLEWWKDHLDKHIGFRLIPKTFLKKDPVILTNKTEKNNLQLSRVNIYIDAPLEVHIISTLWLMYVGRYFSKNADNNNYAYKLELSEIEDESEVVDGLRLFKPYFIQYQNWRDNALKKAEELLNEKKDVAILSLDIKDYFTSVRIELDDLENELFKQNQKLKNNEKVIKIFALLKEVHNIYTQKLKSIINLENIQPGETILPIGLLSSGILGNLYLRGFDELVKEKLNPSYYGRYVDDILFVFSEVSVDTEAIYPINNFLSKYFVQRGILEYNNIAQLKDFNGSNGLYQEQSDIVNLQGDSDYLLLLFQAQTLKFQIKQKSNHLIIQSNKVLLQSFDHRESKAILNKFKKKLEEKRSEFRFLPDEDEVDKQFEEEAFSLQYSDSVNKLRSIKEFSEDKYGASKYLASKIFASSYSDDKPSSETILQILSFFKGVIGLSFYALWEKAITYFLINKQSSAITKFYRQITKAINKISVENLDNIYTCDKEIFLSHLKIDILDYFKISISTPLALNPEYRFTDLNYEEEKVFGNYRMVAGQIRMANMFRHALVSIPSINFTKFLYLQGEGNSKIYFDLVNINETYLQDIKLDMDEKLSLLSPRYVHFHEVNILKIYDVVCNNGHTSDQIFEEFNQLPQHAFKQYWILNYKWKKRKGDLEEEIKILRDEYFKINYDNPHYDTIEINSTEKSVIDKRIAIANIRVNKSNIQKSILKKPNISRDRRQTLFKLINLVEKENCDLFVLPEVSIPYQWIKLLAYQSQKRNIGIIAGLEHWINLQGHAYNFMVTVLPIHRHNYSTCLIKIRLKNHYSHEEKRQLKGYRLLIPGETVDKSFKKYDLFHWEKVYFSVYNCFELADIQDRSLFKSKVDFIIASEYNSDTDYFSEIAGSWVRDLHCYFIQVNSSDFGDSRLLKPAKQFAKNIIQIKGGDNSTILAGELKIESLRNFQLMEYELQKEEIEKDPTTFKPTPPDFNRTNVETRIDDK